MIVILNFRRWGQITFDYLLALSRTPEAGMLGAQLVSGYNFLHDTADLQVSDLQRSDYPWFRRPFVCQIKKVWAQQKYLNVAILHFLCFLIIMVLVA